MSGFEIIIRCDNCDDGIAEDTVGGYTPDRWMEYRAVDCPECEGSGEITLPIDYFLEDIQHVKLEYKDYDIVEIKEILS